MTDKPNVVVFFTDQQRADSCGLNGNPLGLTPNFDRFGQRGTHAKWAFTPQPVCGPARACVQTGLYGTASGCFRNEIPIPKDVSTLAQTFKSGGYSTGYIGKWHLGDPEDIGPVSPQHRAGYDYWLASNVLEMTSDSYDCRVYDNDGQEVKLPGYRVDALTDAAIRHLDDRHSEGKPFLLFLSFLEPHHQNSRDDYPAPLGLADSYIDRWTPPDLAALKGTAPQHLPGYWGMVKRLDDAFGRILDALESLNMRDNTIVVFASDHGCHFKTRNREYKRTCHDSSIRIPMAFDGPGFKGGGELSQLVSLVDLAPTLIDSVGLDVPTEMQGRSILTLVTKQDESWPEEVFVQTSEYELGRSVRTARWKYGVLAKDRDGGRYPSASEYEESFLYDLFADPWELENLNGYDSHVEVAERMKERLIQRMVCAGEERPNIVRASVISSGQRKVYRQEVEQ